MASTAQSTSTSLPKGVAPLRAGTGNSFLWRRLHSLTGIVPVGLFLLEHFLSNSEAINGVAAYNAQVKFLTGLPFRLGLEIFGIFIPLAFHALYGVYIWWRGENNVIDYPWTGNWFYTAAALYRTRRLCLCDLSPLDHAFHRGSSDGALRRSLLEGAARAHASAGAGHLRGGHRCRFLAPRLRTLPLCRQVGHRHRRQGPQAGAGRRNRSFRPARRWSGFCRFMPS